MLHMLQRIIFGRRILEPSERLLVKLVTNYTLFDPFGGPETAMRHRRGQATIANRYKTMKEILYINGVF